MKTPLSVSLAIGATAILAACVTNPATTGRDIGGRTMHLAEWRAVEPREAIINIADLKGASEPGFLMRTEQRVRDNALLQQKIRFNGGAGYIHAERTNGLYDYGTTEYFNDPSTAKSQIDKFYGKSIPDTDYKESRKIYSRGKRGGWLYMVRSLSSAPDRTCVFASIGFLDNPTKNQRTDERYDTGIIFRDCSGTRTPDDIEAFLNALKIVPPEYNRTVGGWPR